MASATTYLTPIPPQTCHIITGPPSAGKTKILQRIRERTNSVAIGTIDESATAVIKYYQGQGVEKPWELKDFQHLIAMDQEEKLESAKKLPVQEIFTDRCYLDTTIYSGHRNEAPTPFMIKKAQTVIDSRFFAKRAFFIEDLGTFKKTVVRHEDKKEAEEIGRRLLQDYTNLGFEMVMVPPGKSEDENENIDERVQFIFKHMRKEGYKIDLQTTSRSPRLCGKNKGRVRINRMNRMSGKLQKTFNLKPAVAMVQIR